MAIPTFTPAPQQQQQNIANALKQSPNAISQMQQNPYGDAFNKGFQSSQQQQGPNLNLNQLRSPSNQSQDSTKMGQGLFGTDPSSSDSTPVSVPTGPTGPTETPVADPMSGVGLGTDTSLGLSSTGLGSGAALGDVAGLGGIGAGLGDAGAAGGAGLDASMAGAGAGLADAGGMGGADLIALLFA